MIIRLKHNIGKITIYDNLNTIAALHCRDLIDFGTDSTLIITAVGEQMLKSYASIQVAPSFSEAREIGWEKRDWEWVYY